MKSRFNGLAVVVLGYAALIGLPAQAALTVKLTGPNGVMVTCVDEGPNDSFSGLVGFVGCNQVSAAFGSIDITIASSNAPAGPATLTKNITLTICNAIPTVPGCGTSPAPSTANPYNFTIQISDSGFLLPSGTATLIDNLTANTPAAALTATGTVTSSGYLSNNNVLFQTSGATTGPVTLNSFATGSAGSASTVTTFAPPFAMTEILNVSATSAGTALFTATLSAVQVVPEPAVAALFGAMLLFIVGVIRRRTNVKRA